MFRNNFKIAIRNLWKNKASTFINVLGLTTGLSSCLLIGLYIQHELSYDNFQDKGERIARGVDPKDSFQFLREHLAEDVLPDKYYNIG